MKIIVDIDNTLCSNKERFYLATRNKNIDWGIVYDDDLMFSDKPNYFMIDLVNRYKKEKVEIIIITGRPERTRKITEKWLNKFKIDYDYLYMRSEEDYYIKSHVLKKKIYETYIKEKIFCAYDDEDEVINMWVSLGIPSFKVYGV